MGFGGGNFSEYDITSLLSGLYAHWTLNESSGSSVADSSGNSRNGTATNMEDGDWIAGKLNNALRLGGTDEYVTCGDIANFSRTSPFSISFWISYTNTSSMTVISRQENTGNKPGWSVLATGGTAFQVIIANTVGGGNGLQTSIEPIINDGTWHHFVMTYDGSSTAAGIKCYIDGALQTSTIIFDNLTASITNVSDCLIGARGVAPAIFYTGDLDDILLFTKELTTSQIEMLYNSGNGLELS